MSIHGRCGVCGSAEGAFGCELCGQVVCEDHYDARTGTCRDCAPGRR